MPERLKGLFGPAHVALRSEEVIFVAPSSRSWASDQFRYHPAWSAARDVLEPAGVWDDVRRRAVEILEKANEDAHAFRVRSEYLIATVRLRP